MLFGGNLIAAQSDTMESKMPQNELRNEPVLKPLKPRESNTDGVYAIFNAEAIKDADLTLDSAGIVSEIFVEVGSEVKKGERLLSLSNADKIAQANSVREQYNFAKKQYQRYEKSSDAIDKNTLENFYATYKQLEANLNYQNAMINKTILRAPYDGVIASKDIELGDGVAANNTKLFRLISKEVKLVIEFDSKYINVVKVGDRYEFAVDGKGVAQSVIITKVYPTASVTNRKVKAEALVKNIIPGTFGDGYIRTK